MGKYYFHHRSQSTMLIEMTDSEYREVETDRDSERLLIYEPIHYTRAHAWVKDGGLHSTPLYIDEGRIRYARDSY